MTSLPSSLQELIEALGALPGIGPRSAERIALHLVQEGRAAAEVLAQKLVQALEKVQFCERCGGLTEVQPCPICSDPNRDPHLLCVVERPIEIPLMEKARVYRGRYHVLGGRISPLRGIEPEDLRIAQLEDRVRTEGIQEVILALSTSVEGDATAHYLAERLRPLGVKVTRLGYGLPAGTDLEFADELTLTRALETRQPVEGS